MHSIEILFSLIHSLTKSEKRYFRMLSDMQKGEKSYMTLYKFLESRTSLNNNSSSDLKRIFPGNTIEPARKHLYHVLMKSLRQFETEKDIEALLMNLLQDSRILYNKGLIKLSFKQLEKIKQIALKREKFMYYILAARQELQYLVHLQFANINEYQLLEKQKKIKELLEQENRLNQHSMLYEVLLLRYWKNGIVRSQKEVTQLNDLLLEEYQLLNSPGDKSFESQQLHLHFQSIYFQMTGNPQGSLNGFYDLDNLFQQHEHLWKEAPLYYFHLLGGILSDLRWMERYDDMDFFIERLKAISSSANGLQLMVKYRILEYKLKTFADQGQYLEAEGLLQHHTPLLSREASQLPFQMYAQWIFTIARIHFGLGNYSTTLKLLNAELNQPARSKDQSLQVNFLLMNLQVNALLKNDNYLIYAIRSIERKLKSERKLFGVEQLIISLLKRWLAFKPLKGHEEQLEKLTNNPHERQLIKELCLEEWIKRMKIQKWAR